MLLWQKEMHQATHFDREACDPEAAVVEATCEDIVEEPIAMLVRRQLVGFCELPSTTSKSVD